MPRIYPNPDFLNKASAEGRRQWYEALMDASHKSAIKQGYGQMYEHETLTSGERVEFVCCLMVGHLAFHGTDNTRTFELPKRESPFIKALAIPVGHLQDADPIIARMREKEYTFGEWETLTASALNDDWQVPFEKIAKLVYPEANDTQYILVE